ncbi:MAG: MarR family transcriptional regulator [Myxococcota bacterium]
MDTDRYVFKLSLAYAAVRAAAAGVREGVTLTRAGALFALGERPDGMAQAELAGLLSLGISGASGLVDRMVADGLVQKTRDPADGRRVLLTLTPVGKRLRKEAAKDAQRLNAALTEGFSSRELSIVSRWLEHAAALNPFAEEAGLQSTQARSGA